MYWCFLERLKKGIIGPIPILIIFFIKISIIFPLFLEYREYIDIFFKSEARQLLNYILIEYTINTGDVKSLYRFIYNLLANELSIFRDNLKEFLEKRYI